jgi:tRNA modification GTPase
MDLVRSRAEADLGTGDAVLTRERHRAALARVADALDRVRPTLAAGRGELAAEDVRLALRALGEITGRVDVEEVLDRLFSTFCIGK